MKFGRFDVQLLTMSRFALDGGAMFGIVPRKLWLRAYPHADAENRVALQARALLIRDGRNIIVADAGIGDKLEPKAAANFGVEPGRSSLESELGRHGISPAQVTHFVYTHCHFDHAGGATRRDDASGFVAPLFPNARHYVQKDHLAWAREPSDKDRASFIPENWEPVAQRGLLEELDGKGELIPGVELRPVHGHTKAMQMVIVHGASSDSASEGLALCVDLVPTAAHLLPHYIAAFDNYPLTVIGEKKAFLQETFERRWTLVFGHDPFIPAAMLQPGKRRFEIAREIHGLMGEEPVSNSSAS